MKEEKPKVIIIYGGIAVGKYTTARILSEKINIPMTHNHALLDLIGEIFPRGSHGRHDVYLSLVKSFMKKCLEYKQGLIFTTTYAADFVADTGETDPQRIVSLVNTCKRAGAEVYLVHLIASLETMHSRATHLSRKKFKKLTDRTILEELSEYRDWHTSAPIRNNHLVIDNTEMEIDSVVDEIMSTFSL